MKRSTKRTLRTEGLEARVCLTGEPLLPDLVPWNDPISGYNHIHDIFEERDGTRLLRFSTAVANVGDGPLMIARRNGDAIQVINNTDGSQIEEFAGRLEFHDGHGHFHLFEYAEYNLRLVDENGGVGPTVTRGTKASFCLLDSRPLSNDSPPLAFYSCGQQRQGITQGWADVYRYDLENQSIDITDVADGVYWLETRFDPLNRIVEADETNNTLLALVQIGGEVYPSDRLEGPTNHLGIGDLHFADLTLEYPGASDWFQWEAHDDGTLSVDLEFDAELGDVDLYVGDSRGNLLASSATETGSEQIRLDVTKGTTYRIYARDLSGETHPNYSLTIDGPDVEADAYEPNDRLIDAFDLQSSETQIEGLTLSSAADTDFFRWVAPESGMMHADVRYDGIQSDFALSFLDERGEVIEMATRERSFRNTELVVSKPVVVGEVVYVRVQGVDRPYSSNYSLFVDLLDNEPDQFEPNDGRAQVASLPQGDLHLRGLNLHAPFNEDHYTWTSDRDGLVEFEIGFRHADGDLSLEIVDVDDDYEDYDSKSTTDNEHVVIRVSEGDEYLIRVDAVAGATNRDYELRIHDAQAPQVVGVAVGGRFRQGLLELSGDIDVPVVPWHDVDTVEISFSRTVSLRLRDEERSLSVVGNDGASYTVVDEQLDANGDRLTWTLDRPIADGGVTIRVEDLLYSGHWSNQLDGDWEQGQGLPSGDGVAGGAFDMQLRVLAGDANQDGVRTPEDIDFVCQNLVSASPQIDFDADGTVTLADYQFLVEQLFQTTAGDANLDGLFDTGDLVRVFRAGHYDKAAGDGGPEQRIKWREGDWNCDGLFDSSDLIAAFAAGGYVATSRSRGIDLAAISAALMGRFETDGEEGSTPHRRDTKRNLLRVIDDSTS